MNLLGLKYADQFCFSTYGRIATAAAPAGIPLFFAARL